MYRTEGYDLFEEEVNERRVQREEHAFGFDGVTSTQY